MRRLRNSDISFKLYKVNKERHKTLIMPSGSRTFATCIVRDYIQTPFNTREGGFCQIAMQEIYSFNSWRYSNRLYLTSQSSGNLYLFRECTVINHKTRFVLEKYAAFSFIADSCTFNGVKQSSWYLRPTEFTMPCQNKVIYIFCGVSVKPLAIIRSYLSLSEFFSHASSVLQLAMPASSTPASLLIRPYFHRVLFLLDHETNR